jgi:hypothetical protein
VNHSYGKPPTVNPGAFNGLKYDGVSVDRAKSCTAEDCWGHSPNPDQVVGIVQLNVGRIRAIKKLEVLSDPIAKNAAHCLIVGTNLTQEELTAARLHLVEISDWVQGVKPPSQSTKHSTNR